ncbi:PAS domain S-box protein [Desulfosediminicola flagellatus]|uniref:PAS domain S-box protein n=1 Tax=Desulfosediminicola flagellatus TaxID=2569541 RepID=UPI0010AD5E58|nr:PAS domain S-box protein [Desulfosediminicola flagellatus]
MEMNGNLLDLIGSEKLNQLQQRFYDATGFANACLDSEGRLLCFAGETEPACMDIIRASSLGLQRCQAIANEKPSFVGGRKSKVLRCHAGMLDGRIPIVVGQKTMGFLVMGQVFDSPPDKEEAMSYANELGLDPEVYWNALKKVRIVSRDKVESAAMLLEFMGREIATMASANIQLQKEVDSRKKTEQQLLRLNSELVKANEELQQERNLFVTGNVVVFKYRNTDGWPVEYVSQNVHELLGYEVEDFLSGKVSYIDLIYPPHLDRVIEEVRGHEHEGASRFSQTPYCLVGKNGQLIWVENFTTVIRDTYQKVTHFQGYLVDITSLKDNEERFRLLVENARDAIFLADSTGRFVMVNEQACISTGYSEQELLTMFTNEIEVGHTDDEILAIFNDLNQGLPHRSQGLHRKKDGTTFPVEVAICSYTTREQTYILGVARDITERQRADQALVESEKRYRSIFDFTPASIWLEDFSEIKKSIDVLLATGVTDLKAYLETDIGFTRKIACKANIIDVNSACQALFEADDRDQLMNRLDRVLNEDRALPLFIEGLVDLASTGKSKSQLYTINTLKGNRRVIRVSSAVDPGCESDWSRVLISQVDVTELLDAQQQAELANHAKSIFLANMSHDLRTPINGIMGTLQLLRSESLEENQQHYVDMGITSCKRLSGIIADILDITKIEAGKLDLHQEPFNFSEVLSSVDDMFSLVAESKKLYLSIQYNTDIPELLIGDENRLSQILMNLVSNAIKFSREGGIKIETDVLHRNGTHAVLLITIADTGIGIADEDQVALFESFTQVANNSERQGAGLGLAIVRQLVLLMGGGLCFESQQGVGSTFYLHLPFHIQDRPAQNGISTHTLHQVIPITSFNALVIEDDKISRIVISRMLKAIGGQVDLAVSGEEGLEMLVINDYDIIFTDVQLPGIDGLEVTRILRHNKKYSHRADIPVVAMTANAMAGDKEKCIDAGMNDYISKPIEVGLLTSVIQRQVSSKKYST